MKQLHEVSAMHGSPVEPEVAVTGDQIDKSQRKKMSLYRGRFWCVPKLFAFLAKVTNLNGRRMWLKGKAVVVDVDSETYMIKPLRQLRIQICHGKSW